MYKISSIIKAAFVLVLATAVSCSDQLDKMNQNPNGVDPATANPNLLLPTVLSKTAKKYNSLGFGKISGVVQHTQEDAWKDAFNDYNWSEEDWSDWYSVMRDNEFLYTRAAALDMKFHQGIALTMRAYIFGTITDLYGDAPYTTALRGNEGTAFLNPSFDSQETIYKGVIEDLKKAAALFATKEVKDYATGYDIFYAGNPEKWQKFANTLLLRYYLRISTKLPDLAKSGAEAVYASGVYMKDASDDAKMDYIGSTSDNSWPNAIAFNSDQSNWRRRRPCQTILDAMVPNDDPRTKVWFQPVHCRWVADTTLTTGVDAFIREDGKLTALKSKTELEYRAGIAAGKKYTRNYNPKLYTPSDPALFAGPIVTSEYVGVPPGMRDPSYFNENPTTGQVCENQHASQLTYTYQASKGDLLKVRLASAAETSFILAEGALKTWSVGVAKTHYETGIKNSLTTWGVASSYDAFIAKANVAYKGTLDQIMQQKWIASWTAATESWFDYRRTGLPALKAGVAPTSPVLPLRLIYGANELNTNTANVNKAIDGLEQTTYSGPKGKNSQWSKMWLQQGTGKPW